MARKGSPDSRDKLGIQAKLATGGGQATPYDRVTRVIREIQAKLVTGGTQATPDDRVTRVIREIRDKRATPAIEASPLHAPTDSITIPILTTEG